MLPVDPQSLSRKREPRDDARFLLWAVLVAAVACALRWSIARHVDFCRTPDACFYLGMGETLAAGKGFHARFLYDFQLPHLALPNTGIEYWRPGISLLLLVLKPFGGVTLHSSIVLTLLVGVLFAASAWHLALRETADRGLALRSFALCLFFAPVWVGSMTPDSNLYYGAAVAWFFALLTVRRQGWLQDLLAIACAGLAYLIRNDAVLLLVPLLAVLYARWRGLEAASERRPGFLRFAFPLLAAFFLALLPMHLLYRAVLGQAFPSGTASVLFLNTLDDFVRYNDPVSLHSLLSHGVAHLVFFRVSTLVTLLYRVAALMIGYPALVVLPGLLWPPAAVADEPRVRLRTPLTEWIGPVSFGLATVVLYTLLLPAIGAFSALRTLMALLPFAAVAVMIAISRLVRTPRQVLWTSGAVILAALLSGLMDSRRDLADINGTGTTDRAEKAVLAGMHGNPERSIVLTDDPVQFSVTTGYATVALPNNGLDAIAAAARDFRATHLIVKTTHMPASLEVLQERLHPVAVRSVQGEQSLILELPAGGNGL